jgi:AraC-like DNA-binding protein
MWVQRQPSPLLRPYVYSLWANAGPHNLPCGQNLREHVLPTGHMHLVFRLGDAPLRFFDSPQDTHGRVLDSAVIGGARDAYYIKDVSQPADTVGCQLKPGAALALFGFAAHEFTGRHTGLDALWGAAAQSLRMQLLDTADLGQRLAIFEAALAEQLRPQRVMHPAIAQLLPRLGVTTSIASLVEASGLSHRHFNAVFADAVGLSPKRYARVLRFQQALHLARQDKVADWSDIALHAGYSDQAHWCREFRAFCGLTPGQYLERNPLHANHVPVAG